MAETPKTINMDVKVNVDTDEITEQVREALRTPRHEMALALFRAANEIDPEFIEWHNKNVADAAVTQERARVSAEAGK